MKNAHPQNAKTSANSTTSILKSRLYKCKPEKPKYQQLYLFDEDANNEIFKKSLSLLAQSAELAEGVS